MCMFACLSLQKEESRTRLVSFIKRFKDIPVCETVDVDDSHLFCDGAFS